MATVTFPIELGGSGLVVSDDTDPTTGLRNGGYLTRFVPALQQTVAVAGFVVGQASNAAASASAAAGSASAASSSASSAASSAASAATLYDQFDDRYLGPKASNPTVDNDGNALLVGAMYFNTSALETRVWNGTTWQTASVNGGTVNSLIVTGALQYQGTLTGGTGVIDIGEGQIFKDAEGNVYFGASVGVGPAKFRFVGADENAFLRIDGISNTTFIGSSAAVSGAPSINYSAVRGLNGLVVSGSGASDLIIDPAGNAGLGVTPSAWGSDFAAMQYGFSGAVSSYKAGTAAEFMLVTSNAYNDNTNWRYIRDGAATRFEQNEGATAFFTAPSGTAGNPITFTQAATLFQNGNYALGRTSTVFRFDVAAADGNVAKFAFDGGDAALDITSPTGNTIGITAAVGDTLTLGANGAESARIGTTNYIKASNTGTYQNASGSGHDFETSIGNALTAYNSDLGGGANVITAVGVGAYTGRLYVGVNNGAVNYQVNSDGSLQNATNSYGALSDPKLKDIIGTKGSTWEKTKQYNWIEYYLKSDTEHTFKMLGLNAEEAAAVSPGVVDESPDLVQVTKVRQVPVRIVRLDENENPIVDEETGEVIYDEVLVDEEYTEWEPNGEFTKSLKYSVVSMQYHRTTQECQQRIESLEAAKVQADDLIQQIMARVAALESASA